ncbi:MAG: hypothetical protein JNM20_18320 [Rhizobiales bacterium]|nr:hypothetical protein [Hyphomicrobiales bacterium]
MTAGGGFFAKGWRHFGYDATVAAWVARTLPQAREAVRAPGNAQWLRSGGTWFVGVNALPNDRRGAVPGGLPLAGAVVDFIRDFLGFADLSLEQAQVSVCYPGYPQPMPSETPAAFAYRRDRAAAHLDGLHAEGPARRRFFREAHSFLLGLPMVAASPDASPFVIWEGSHEILRAALRQAFAGIPTERWSAVDVTEAYHAARRRIFAECKEVTIAAKPGEAYLVHRLALHGMARWGEGASAGPDGRMIVYFRPILFGPDQWLNAP